MQFASTSAKISQNFTHTTKIVVCHNSFTIGLQASILLSCLIKSNRTQSNRTSIPIIGILYYIVTQQLGMPTCNFELILLSGLRTDTMMLFFCFAFSGFSLIVAFCSLCLYCIVISAAGE